MNDLLTSEDHGQAAGLQFFAREVVEGFCSGLHRSPHKGVSVEFKQHRQYVAGDEIRHLDWRVFGKTDRFYIREYEEETNLRCTLLLDCSGSMGYEGSGFTSRQTPTKLDYARRLAACFAYLMLAQQDSVAIATFDDQVREVIPNRSTAGHLQALIEVMLRRDAGGDGELGDVLGTLAPKLGRRGLVVILSDCFGDTERLRRGLAHLRHGRNEVLLFQIWDRDELEFPFQQWTQFESLEIDGVRQKVDPAHLRSAYLENLERFRSELQEVCNRNRVELVSMVTDQPYAAALSRYLASRQRKQRR
ncbi:MAG: DUF58 domain-containing protein [Pirellulales bacterium]|nr:DUF58 domain-containing protein [Pirellulales bacterium]